MKLRIATRGSALALAQARNVQRALEERGADCELKILRTTGDANTAQPFAQVGAAGLFVREIEQALLTEEAELAVHSYKDLPSDSPTELVVAAVPGREDPRDRLLMLPAAFEAGAPGLPLRKGARVGTAAARRTALLRDLRPDLEPKLLRGNVPTRVGKLIDGEFDAILLAAAGLDRLEAAAARGECEAPDRTALVEHALDVESFIPAPSQGAVAIQVRRDDARTSELVQSLDDPRAQRTVEVERALLALVQAGCDVPFGAHCREVADELELIAALERDGVLHRARALGTESQALAEKVFARLMGSGGSKA